MEESEFSAKFPFRKINMTSKIQTVFDILIIESMDGGGAAVGFC